MAALGEGCPLSKGVPWAWAGAPALPCSSQHQAQPVLCSAAGEICQGPSVEGVGGKAQGEAAPVNRELQKSLPRRVVLFAGWVLRVLGTEVWGSGAQQSSSILLWS